MRGRSGHKYRDRSPTGMLGMVRKEECPREYATKVLLV